MIDPCSTLPASPDFSAPSVYNDDGGGGRQAKITKTLTPYVHYLVIVSAYNISGTSRAYNLNF